MKTFKIFVTVLCLTFVGSLVKATDSVDFRKPEKTQIQDLLKSIEFDKFITGETKLAISFIINAQNEVIVVSTNNSELDAVVKNTLNYKRISVTELEYNKIYTIPVVIR